MKNIRKEKGITLVALVITIILLLILAGIAISALTKNEILGKSQQTVEKHKIEQAREKISLAIADYEVKMRKETIYSILNKIDGLQSIEPDNEQAGLPYKVIVDGYEFEITKELEIIYIEKIGNEIKIPEIISIRKNVTDEENVKIEIKAKTEDIKGIEKIILIKDGIEIEEKNVLGKEILEEFNIKGNGIYKIKVVGKNSKKSVAISDEIQVTEMTRLSGIIKAGTVIEGKVLLTIEAEVKEDKIEKVQIYEKNSETLINEIAKENMHINETEEKTNIEAYYEVEYIGFYEEKEYYAKIIAKTKEQETINKVRPQNIDTIKTVEDLERLAIQVNEKNNTFENKTINLKANIETKANWIPIGYYDGNVSWTVKYYFGGIFEGNNNQVTITSLNKDTKYKSSGLFGAVKNGVIRNLKVSGTMDADCNYLGGIAGGVLDGTIYNCTNNANITDKNNICHGGIVGITRNSIIEKCINNGTIYGKSQIGGIVGHSEQKTNIYSCTNLGSISCYGTYTEQIGTIKYEAGTVGGIVGIADNTHIEGCINGTSTNTIGSKSVSPNGIAAGGIAGFSYNESIILKCKNIGKIYYELSSGYANTGSLGGIVGALVESSVEQSYNTGIVTAKHTNGNLGIRNVGGIVGYARKVTINNTYNKGSIYGYNYVGGLIGNIEKLNTSNNENYMNNNYNVSNDIISSTESNVGNIFGYASNVTGVYNAWLTGESYGIMNSATCKLTIYDTYTLDEIKLKNKGVKTTLSLIELLSQGNGAGIWSQSSSINEGLPYLAKNKPD